MFGLKSEKNFLSSSSTRSSTYLAIVERWR